MENNGTKKPYSLELASSYLKHSSTQELPMKWGIDQAKDEGKNAIMICPKRQIDYFF
ncbi:hypothetical protein [Sphingobacterium sp. CZ-UAM]|uniref:hypothetical protein n=1 Tax=Sphingobacterium sp. CZ-UAM TaxID=1933868 RepID=UPI00158A730B|nr:hypothetical protein [Sphingobacterium sp. CZ-UAM]